MEIYANNKKIADSNAWINTNRSFIKSYTILNTKDEEYIIYFENCKTVQEEATWLKNNWKHIDFEKSRANIESAHVILKIPVFFQFFSLADFLTERIFSKISITDLIKSDNELFILDTYAKYLEFDGNGKLKGILSDYDVTKNCYSYPFFKSIVLNNQVVKADYDTTFFYFYPAKIDGIDTIAFAVETKDKAIFYDFSHDPPPRGGGPLIFPLFSKQARV